ncbi:hypothetical protein RvY_11649-2 [Ramazzottius varieornatus]|uniref:Uncharacterized protein n=1 Tax=Ramazzottius varieornatus TaxID=947166 RepID=A0A1D1VM75_RAMVA|nr:hypothetical protein RvY_11649-2 [Ramazzottius varieornatus]
MPAAGTARKSQRVPAPAPYPQPSRSRGKAKKDTVTAPAPARRSPKGKSVAVLAPLAPYRMAILEQKFDQLTGLVSNIALINGQNRTIITQRSNGESDRDLSPSSDKVTVPATARSQLQGPVGSSGRHSLLHPSQTHITPLAELLPENRITNINGKVPKLSLSGKGDFHIRKNVSQKKPFRNFADFSAAFSVFMAYRITVDPKLAISLARYLEVVATIARTYPNSSKWMHGL